MPVRTAILISLSISTAVLFCVGAYKAKTTVGKPLRSGIEMALIGMLAALVGYAIGALLGTTVIRPCKNTYRFQTTVCKKSTIHQA